MKQLYLFKLLVGEHLIAFCPDNVKDLLHPGLALWLFFQKPLDGEVPRIVGHGLVALLEAADYLRGLQIDQAYEAIRGTCQNHWAVCAVDVLDGFDQVIVPFDLLKDGRDFRLGHNHCLVIWELALVNLAVAIHRSCSSCS